jgi:hypothetical protein
MLCDLDGEALMKQFYDMEFHVWEEAYFRDERCADSQGLTKNFSENVRYMSR